MLHRLLAHFLDAFEYDLCRYYCHAESWTAKLTKCGYVPPTISEVSPSSDRKMVWEKVKSERQRALDWWSELDPTCYPLPEPPYTPPPPTGNDVIRGIPGLVTYNVINAITWLAIINLGCC